MLLDLLYMTSQYTPEKIFRWKKAKYQDVVITNKNWQSHFFFVILAQHTFSKTSLTLIFRLISLT